MIDKMPWWWPKYPAEYFCGHDDCPVCEIMDHANFLFQHEQVWAIRKGLA